MRTHVQLLLLAAAAGPLPAGANWGECVNTCTPETAFGDCVCSFYNQAVNAYNYAYSVDSLSEALSKVVSCPGTGQYKAAGPNRGGVYAPDSLVKYVGACVYCPAGQYCNTVGGCDYSCSNNNSSPTNNVITPSAAVGSSSLAASQSTPLLALPLILATLTIVSQ